MRFAKSSYLGGGRNGCREKLLDSQLMPPPPARGSCEYSRPISASKTERPSSSKTGCAVCTVCTVCTLSAHGALCVHAVHCVCTLCTLHCVCTPCTLCTLCARCARCAHCAHFSLVVLNQLKASHFDQSGPYQGQTKVISPGITVTGPYSLTATSMGTLCTGVHRIAQDCTECTECTNRKMADEGACAAPDVGRAPSDHRARGSWPTRIALPGACARSASAQDCGNSSATGDTAPVSSATRRLRGRVGGAADPRSPRRPAALPSRLPPLSHAAARQFVGQRTVDSEALACAAGGSGARSQRGLGISLGMDL
jgi:hypothetical protein